MPRRTPAPLFALPLLGWLPLLANAADSREISLLSTPVSVTAELERGDSGYVAQISVHSGPIAHVISTEVVGESSNAAAEQLLKQFVQVRSPYILVRELCTGTAWQCESVAVLKVAGNVVIRMGDFIGTFDSVVRDGRLYDVYNKLEQKVDGLSHASSPSFRIALDDAGNALQVNADQTWAINQSRWQQNSEALSTLNPERNWIPADWERYMSALVTNAALARYCQRQEELRSLLGNAEPKLDILHRRALTDALSMVTPLELPRAWRRTR